MSAIPRLNPTPRRRHRRSRRSRRLQARHNPAMGTAMKVAAAIGGAYVIGIAYEYFAGAHKGDLAASAKWPMDLYR